MIEELLKQIVTNIGSVVLTSGLFYLALKHYGTKWLDHKFAERLAVFKHEQAKEIEEVRFRINSIFDRLTNFIRRNLKFCQRLGKDSLILTL